MRVVKATSTLLMMMLLFSRIAFSQSNERGASGSGQAFQVAQKRVVKPKASRRQSVNQQTTRSQTTKTQTTSKQDFTSNQEIRQVKKSPVLKKSPTKIKRRQRQVKRRANRPSPKKKVSDFSISSDGEVRIESRQFENDNKTHTKDYNLGIFTRLKIRAEHGNWKEFVKMVARADNYDPSRSIFFFEEAYVQYTNGGFGLTLGSQTITWSATEAFHPADIINSRNFDSNLENAEKIGEPMLTLAYAGGDSKISLMFMPMLIKPVLPAMSNRLSFSNDFPTLKPQLINRNGKVAESEFETQYAARFEHTFSDADISLHYVDHIDRSTPIIRITPFGVAPIYLPVKQIGGTFQMVAGDWVYKAEVGNRSYMSFENSAFGKLNIPDHTQVAFGVEYGWAIGSGAEIAWVLEGQHLLGITKEERAGISIFQNDILFGMRFALNDIYNQEYFISAIHDLERESENLLNLDYKRRVSDMWTMNLGIRVIKAPPKGQIPVGLELLDGASQAYLNLTRYF